MRKVGPKVRESERDGKLQACKEAGTIVLLAVPLGASSTRGSSALYL